MKKIAVAIHAIEDFDHKIIEELEDFDYIHVDVMDGKFVNNKNINLKVFRVLKENYDIPIVAHLMVINPFDYIEKIIDFIDVFLFHYEVRENKSRVINEVKSHNKKIGIVIDPDTKIIDIISLLNKIDYVLVMSVYPGWSGQTFIPETITRVNSLAEYKNQFNFEIIVDGGINIENAKKLINVDIISSSSAILGAEDPNSIIKILKYLGNGN